VLVLEALIRRNHHSDATFHAWRANSPLRQLLSKDGDLRPQLRKLILEAQNRGMTLDFEGVLTELATFWSGHWSEAENQQVIRKLINCYYPVGSAISGQDRMGHIFEQGLEHMTDIVQ
jgi:hypothetical protein